MEQLMDFAPRWNTVTQVSFSKILDRQKTLKGALKIDLLATEKKELVEKQKCYD